MRILSLINVQAQMALKADATQTYLSYLWWLLEPILYVALFYLVFEVLLLRGSPGFLYFLIVGKVAFLWVSKSLNQGANSIMARRGLIGQTRISMLIFVYATLLESVYKQLFVFAVLIVFMMAMYGSSPGWHWLWLVPIVLVNLMFIMALTLPMAWLTTVIPDVRNLLPMISMFLMFTSGIFFDINEIADPFYRELLLTYQPLAFIIDAYRQVLMHNQAPDGAWLGLLAAVFMAIILCAHWLFSRSQYFLARKVLS